MRYPGFIEHLQRGSRFVIGRHNQKHSAFSTQHSADKYRAPQGLNADG
jgi:hypothetical protein